MQIREDKDNGIFLVKDMNAQQQLAVYDVIEFQKTGPVSFAEDTIMIYVNNMEKFAGLKESLDLVRVGLKTKQPVDDLDDLMNQFEQQADRYLELKGISYDTKLSIEQEMEMKLCAYEMDHLKGIIRKYIKIA